MFRAGFHAWHPGRGKIKMICEGTRDLFIDLKFLRRLAENIAKKNGNHGTLLQELTL
jgi:hypothetical protein